MPDWRWKVAAQRTFSAVPGGHRLNYFFQRHVTHGLPLSDAKLEAHVDLAIEHLAGITAGASRDLVSGTLFEFGAGWDLHTAQVLWCLGVDHQVVVDIRPLQRPELVLEVGRRLAAMERSDLVRRPHPPEHGDVHEYLCSLGIDYRAPCDARDTGLPSGSIDAVTSTDTLEHIPPLDIAAILRECHRVLADDGRMSFRIDYSDHYSHFDSSLSAYHFLRYDERAWARRNPSLHFQNRLRHHDHLALVRAAGFEVLCETIVVGSEDHRAALAVMPLAPRFRGRSRSDLAVTGSRLVLAKSPRAAGPSAIPVACPE